MGTAIKYLVPDRVKPIFVFLTPGHSDAQRIGPVHDSFLSAGMCGDITPYGEGDNEFRN